MIAVFATILLGGVDFRPCEVDGQKAECGRVPVLENRAQPRDRKIHLHVAVIRLAAGKFVVNNESASE